MTRILMIVYGITAEQAAARAPAAQFAVTSVIAALFVWLDSMGRFDDVGRWMGRKLRERCDTIYCTDDGTIVGCDRCLEAADAWEVNECFPEKE